MISDNLKSPTSGLQKSVIGYGGSSTVLLCIEEGKQFALKLFSRDDFCVDSFINEIEILFKLNHPCILHIFSCCFPSHANVAEIHMEYASNGSLGQVLKRAKTLDIPQFWNPTGISIIVCGIVLGLRFVHSRGFIHRDLKPSNILINDKGWALISDFGIARLESSPKTATGDAGTIQYAAPEMFEEGDQTTKIDVFAFGLVLYEILLGRPVFSLSQTPYEIMRHIIGGEMPAIPDRVLPVIKQVIEGCWSLNPNQRPSVDDILHAFRSVNYEIVPGADRDEVSSYVRGVRDWEEMYRVKLPNLRLKFSNPDSHDEF
jgi:serine/threonine protein kinase